MPEFLRRPPEVFLLLASGLCWLLAGTGPVSFLLTLPAGALLLGSGVAAWFAVDDLRVSQFGAFGAVLGVLVTPLLLLIFGVTATLGLALLAVLGFLAAGALALREVQPVEDAPQPARRVSVFAEVALDEAVLALGTQLTRAPAQSVQRRIVSEVETAHALFSERGYFDAPASFHRAPPPAEPHFQNAHLRSLAYEHATFESGYEPRADEPGGARWQEHAPGRTAHAWVLRGAPERPWLVCIHGYQMGLPPVDLFAFRARRLQQMGLNLVFPVLPLHGPRARGRISGLGFISGEFLDMLHAEAQAMWDIRALLAWVRAQGATRTGVYGLSLGGYNAALLSGLEPGLACAIAGIPATDLVRLVWRHSPRALVTDATAAGLSRAKLEQVLSVVSPLRIAPQVPQHARAIFGGSADRLVPPDHVRDLWRHWERPNMEWYEGAHMTFGRHKEVERIVRATVTQHLLTSSSS